MANLKDIAAELGVSISTVSRALNGSSEISHSVTEEVRACADRLGYNVRARRRAGTVDSNTAGIIVPEITSDYYAQLIQLAKKALTAKGYSTIIKLTEFKTSEMVQAISSMSQIQVQCLLIIMDTEEAMNTQIVNAMRRCSSNIMLITSKYYPLHEFDCIYLDEYSGIVMGIQHLKQRGYTRIGCISDKISASRITIFKQAMKLLDMPVEPQYICVGSERAENGGYLRMKELLAMKIPPDALFCAYDQMAIGALHAMHENNLHAPEDMAIIGFDNITVSKYIEGGLTTIENPCEDMISIAVSILDKRTKNRRAAQQIALRPNLIVRSTT